MFLDNFIHICYVSSMFAFNSTLSTLPPFLFFFSTFLFAVNLVPTPRSFYYICLTPGFTYTGLSVWLWDCNCPLEPGWCTTEDRIFLFSRVSWKLRAQQLETKSHELLQHSWLTFCMGPVQIWVHDYIGWNVWTMRFFFYPFLFIFCLLCSFHPVFYNISLAL